METIIVTKEEQKAIASLKRLAKKWPSSLTLFSHSGSLNVLKNNCGDIPVDIDVIVGIRNDGGDPEEGSDYLSSGDFNVEYEEVK